MEPNRHFSARLAAKQQARQANANQPLIYAKMGNHVEAHQTVPPITLAPPPQVSVAISTRVPGLVSKQFALFPRLPAELRQLIWTLIILTPQLVTLKGINNNGIWYPSLAASHRPLLRVNREARYVFLTIKERFAYLTLNLKTAATGNFAMIGNMPSIHEEAFVSAPKMFVNPFIDMVWMDVRSLKLCGVTSFWLDIHIQYLALDYTDWMGFCEGFESWARTNVFLGQRVKEIVFVVGGVSRTASTWNTVLIKPTTSPHIALHDHFWNAVIQKNLRLLPDDPRNECTWESLEEWTMKLIEVTRNKIEEIRKAQLNNPEWLAKHPSVPAMTVKFMEAATLTY